jgi:hypothetical protein
MHCNGPWSRFDPPNTGLYGVSGVIVSKWVSRSPKYLHQRKIPGPGRSGGARAEWGVPSLSSGSPQPLTIDHLPLPSGT